MTVAASSPPVEALDEDVIFDDAVAFIKSLLKCLKTLNLYEHQTEQFGEYIRPSFEKLSDMLAEYGSLPLKLSPFSLKYKNQVVYEDESRSNLTYKFYRDGMRFIVFKSELTEDEFLRFVMLARDSVSEKQKQHDDMVTRFWMEAFDGIDHVVVDNFDFEDIDDEEVEAEVEKIVAYLREQLAANTEDITRFARLSVQDLDLELDDLDQIAGGIVTGRTATPKDKARMQTELIEERKTRLFSKMTLILFQVIEFESEPSEREILFDAVVQVLDLLLVSDDIAGAVGLIHRFDKVLLGDLSPERKSMVEGMRADFRKAMVESQRLDQLEQYLALAKTLDVESVKAYLLQCSDEELIALINLLSKLERVEARTVLVEVLAKIGRHQPEVFARRLETNASSLVKDMLAILHLIKPPNLVELVSKCLDHPNVMIRLEGLRSMSKSRDRESLRYIEQAMNDDDSQMRFGAYRALAERDPNRASTVFIKAMSSNGFHGRDRREKVTVATALGETKTQEALEYFENCFKGSGSLFSRARVTDAKQLAIVGLSAMVTVEAFKVLNRELKERRHGREVLEACHKAAVRLKDRIEKERNRG